MLSITATDLKTGLKVATAHTATHVVYCVPRVWRCLVDIMPRLQDDTQSWDLLLAKGGEHKGLSGVWLEWCMA